MKRLATLLLALTLPCAAAATDYTVRPELSQLGFNGTYQGAAFNGSFNQWTAAISYDPAHLASSRFDVTVTLASAKTGDHDQDSALPGADFFDVAKFPTAHFVTTGFHQDGTQVIADGQLTLRGVTKPLSLTVVFKSQGNSAVMDVAGVLKRLDFGVGIGDYSDTSVIGANVKIIAHLQLASK
ncbi:YceI family protein [Rhodanobacter sp. C01]|uniref:YceI family protein n=1 Tax=Rhodanobacter sp. C01 TaxID=1945856 RepID=UPI000984D2E6|nr:YceI family protein [Rhodanobacter sp. C01]OOG45425.1 polyisoprenoid-binding protein [Rhodanobacter sp. C01]